jgi:hypothetical protein
MKASEQLILAIAAGVIVLWLAMKQSPALAGNLATIGGGAGGRAGYIQGISANPPVVGPSTPAPVVPVNPNPIVASGGGGGSPLGNGTIGSSVSSFLNLFSSPLSGFSAAFIGLENQPRCPGKLLACKPCGAQITLTGAQQAGVCGTRSASAPAYQQTVTYTRLGPTLASGNAAPVYATVVKPLPACVQATPAPVGNRCLIAQSSGCRTQISLLNQIRRN